MTALLAQRSSFPRGEQSSVRTYARIGSVLLLISLVAGGFGEWYAPSRLMVSNDAAATARNIVTNDWLFRAGFAGYLLEALCDIGLTLIFYVLLRPVSRNVALLATLFRIMGTALFAAAELFYFAPRLILSGAAYLNTFSPGQLDSLALLSLKLYGAGAAIFMVFYGSASVLLGYLIYRSGFLPRVLGVLMALGGAGFVISNFVVVLAPRYASPAFALPTVVATVALTVWLLARGVDVRAWQQSASKIGTF